MPSETGVERVLDALRETTDLDALQALYVSNTTADNFAPWLQRWLRDLLAQERQRRETGDEPQYVIVDMREWPAAELVATAMFSIGVIECLVALQKPTLNQFGVRLANHCVACLGTEFLDCANE